MAETVFSFCGLNLGAIIRGILVRLLFALHAGACVVFVMDLVDDQRLMWPVYMYGGFGVLMLLDACWVLCGARKSSLKLFSPTIALYIMCTVPCIWFMEQRIFAMKKQAQNNDTTDYDEIFEDIPLSSTEDAWLRLLLPLRFKLPTWSAILVQLMMFILIIGRWLLPKGKLSRDQLSQLLLVQIGMAADILEFLTVGLATPFESNVGVNLVLAVWTWSLPQFTLSLTLKKAKKPKVVVWPAESINLRKAEIKDYYGWCEIICATEMWSIFLSAIVMQDLPFLTLRMYIMFSFVSHAQITPQAVFFSCKNALVIALQIYRITVIVSENRQKKKAWKSRSLEEGIAGRCENPKASGHVVAPRQAGAGDIWGESGEGSVWHTQQAWGYLPIADAEDPHLRRRDVSLQTECTRLSDGDS